MLKKPDGAYSHHQALRVKATERIRTVCEDASAQRFPLPAYCCIPLHFPLAYIKNSKDVRRVCYQTVIPTNTSVNRKARWLEGNSGKHAAGGRVTAEGRSYGPDL